MGGLLFYPPQKLNDSPEKTLTFQFGSAHYENLTGLAKLALQRQRTQTAATSHVLSEVIMTNESNNNTNSGFMGGAAVQGNSLMQYVQSMEPEMIAQLSRPVSGDVMQAMELNIIALLGGLPSEGFDVSVTTSRETLGRLLASAMMGGYFLKSAEQRLDMETSLMGNLKTDLDN